MSKNGLFQIGAVARKFKISVETLRYYERIGLLIPEYVDSENGYRYYGYRQFEILNTVRYLRTLGVGLDEIVRFVKNRDVGGLKDMLRRQKETVVRKIAELQRIERKIDNRLNWLFDAETVRLNRIELKLLPPCRMVAVKDPREIGNFLDREPPVDKLGEKQKEAVLFLGKVGAGVSIENLEKGNFGKYKIFFLILDDEDIFDDGAVIRCPETRAAVVRFCGTHAQARGHYRELMTFIRENSLKINGFSREIALMDNTVSSDDTRFVTQIAVPVE